MNGSSAVKQVAVIPAPAQTYPSKTLHWRAGTEGKSKRWKSSTSMRQIIMRRLFVAAINAMSSEIHFLGLYRNNCASIESKKERGNWLRLRIRR
jgi:hypothetical protein